MLGLAGNGCGAGCLLSGYRLTQAGYSLKVAGLDEKAFGTRPMRSTPWVNTTEGCDQKAYCAIGSAGLRRTGAYSRLIQRPQGVLPEP